MLIPSAFPGHITTFLTPLRIVESLFRFKRIYSNAVLLNQGLEEWRYKYHDYLASFQANVNDTSKIDFPKLLKYFKSNNCCVTC